MRTADNVIVFLLSFSIGLSIFNYFNRLSFYENQTKLLAQMELDNANTVNEILDSVKEIENKIKAMENK
nr:MAG: hypothetical protein [Caudoviricetes sp.]